MSTYKQKLTATKLVENGGNLGKAMLQAGYSKAMAKNPQKLTRSKGWSEANDDVLSDKHILEIHNQLLESIKVNKLIFPINISDSEIRSMIESTHDCKVILIKHLKNSNVCSYSTPDNTTILKAIELGYKLHGTLNAPKNK